MIKNNRKSYYEAFEICENNFDCGDLTPFILMFLELVEKAAEDVYSRFESGAQRLTFYKDMLSKTTLSEKDFELLYVLIQNELFSEDMLSREELSGMLSCSLQTVTRRLNNLQENYPIRITQEGRKYLPGINLKVLEQMYKD